MVEDRSQGRKTMGTPIRVLVVEDSEDDAALLLRELRRGGYNPVSERVDTHVSMNDALAKQAWDLIICDYTMPHFSAPAALGLLKNTGLDVPFIIVSGNIGELGYPLDSTRHKV
jgi:CheY-like chemotaxis protein